MNKYQQNFNELVTYIENNLEQKLDIDELCNKTCLSKFHFHRLCSASWGMSVMSLVRLLRLKRAAYQLAYRQEIKVLDIALTSGYESHEAFSRAFSKSFAKSPSAFRRSPNWCAWHQHYARVMALRSRMMIDKLQLQVELVNFPQTQVAVMEHRAGPDTVSRTIQKFIQWQKENRLPPIKSQTFNLLYDDPNMVTEQDYRLDICCAIQAPIAENHYGVIEKSIPAGKCARVRHKGSDDGLGVLIHALYAKCLSEPEYELRHFPLFLHRVSYFPDVSEGDMLTDIYLPLL